MYNVRICMRVCVCVCDSHVVEGSGVDPDEASTVDEDLGSYGALCDQL